MGVVAMELRVVGCRARSRVGPMRAGRLRGDRQRRRRSSMINTTMVEISPAAMTSWPIGLDRPVGSIRAVCLKLRSARVRRPRSAMADALDGRRGRTFGRDGHSGDESDSSALGRVVPCD